MYLKKSMKWVGVMGIMILVLVATSACGSTDGGQTEPVQGEEGPGEPVEEEEQADEHMDEADMADEHMDDEHMDDEGMADEHMDDEHMDDEEHAHAEAEIIEGAPVYELTATDFEYGPSVLEVPTGPFTIQLDNEGLLEHDWVIEGFEDAGGAHVLPGESGMASYNLEPGTYTYYCTVVGHREAGMEGVLVVAG